MISTKHSAETVTVCKNNYTCEKPTVVLDYNVRKCARFVRSDDSIFYTAQKNAQVVYKINYRIIIKYISYKCAIII